MKKNAFVLLALFLLVSCKEVSFREPQPKGRKALNSIPSRIQGKYLPYEDDGGLAKDTIVINQKGYRFGYFEDVSAFNHRASYEEGALGDSLVLKSYRGYYFLNIRQETGWILRVIRQERNGDLTYMTLEQEGVDFKDYVRKISYELPVDSVTTGKETVYYIDPGPSQLVGLIEKGFLTKTPLKKIR